MRRDEQSRRTKIRTTRKIAFTREVFIERDDFAEVPPPKYFRLKPGGEVRLKYACIIKCDEVVKDAAGNIVELRCTADLDTRAGGPNVDSKVKGTIHWVSATQCIDAEVRLYDRLFTVAEPERDRRLQEVHQSALARDRHREARTFARQRRSPAERFQFERLGYFVADAKTAPPASRFQPHDHVERHLGEKVRAKSPT